MSYIINEDSLSKYLCFKEPNGIIPNYWETPHAIYLKSYLLFY